MQPTASYAFSFDDYRTLVAAVQSRTRFGRWSMHMLFIAVMMGTTLAGFVFAVVMSGRLPSVPLVFRSLSVSLAVTALMLGVYEAMTRLTWLQKKGFRRMSIADKAISYELGETGVAWRREGSAGSFEWSTVQTVCVGPEAIVLMLARQEGAVLPRRAFASAEAYAAARRFVADHVAAGTPTIEI